LAEPLRILDLGCHDGYVGAWLRERFDGELVLDGVELHPEASAQARRRGYRKVVEGRAEDIEHHLEAGSYDAVVMYELIEHVPDVDQLLAAAERMLKPGGRVFVSTPDGTFGAGRNPHHLRALRAIDLADTLRRRGHLDDLVVGGDGIAAATYRPADRKGEIAIYTGRSFIQWSPIDIVTRGLGGSETAAVRLANALSELGHVVTVYGDVEEGCFRDVVFRNVAVFDPTVERHAVIASRLPEVFDWPLNCDRRLLWLHDTDCGDRLTPARADRIDAVLTLSGWHEQHVADLYPFLNGKVARIRNGIDLRRFDEDAGERRRRVVYTSSPDRGLDILLELWPRVREQVPDAELAYCSSPFYEVVADQNPRIGEHRARCRELEKNCDGVERLGSLSQPDLAKLLAESMVWTHPSWCTPADIPFNETSCIAALEAQAAGCAIVASAWGALPETVRDPGILVDRLDDEPAEAWRERFAAALVDALTSETLQREAAEQGPQAVADLGWDGVARQVTELLATPDVKAP
jgi:glycosyltransferase involved in cell wall biosynthesis